MSGYYVGVKACGCGERFIRDNPKYKNEIAEMMRECLQDGLTVEHVTHERGGEMLDQECTHEYAGHAEASGPLFQSAV